MTREEAIVMINGLYPVDTEYEATRIIAEKLLAQAKRETEDWRNLPDLTLFRYAELCEDFERRTEREIYKNLHAQR